MSGQVASWKDWRTVTSRHAWEFPELHGFAKEESRGAFILISTYLSVLYSLSGLRTEGSWAPGLEMV